MSTAVDISALKRLKLYSLSDYNIYTGRYILFNNMYHLFKHPPCDALQVSIIKTIEPLICLNVVYRNEVKHII